MITGRMQTYGEGACIGKSHNDLSTPKRKGKKGRGANKESRKNFYDKNGIIILILEKK